MGVDLEKKRKLLLYPIEYQRGCPCEWVLEFARVGDVQQIGKKGDRIYVLSQRVHERSCRAERGSGRDARTRRIVIG